MRRPHFSATSASARVSNRFSSSHFTYISTSGARALFIHTHRREQPIHVGLYRASKKTHTSSHPATHLTTFPVSRNILFLDVLCSRKVATSLDWTTRSRGEGAAPPAHPHHASPAAPSAAAVLYHPATLPARPPPLPTRAPVLLPSPSSPPPPHLPRPRRGRRNQRRMRRKSSSMLCIGTPTLAARGRRHRAPRASPRGPCAPGGATGRRGWNL